MALGDGGLDAQVEQRMDAYRGNPQKLQQRYGQNKELLDLLALQKLTSEKKKTAAAMALSQEQQPGTIAQQREQEALGLVKNEMSGSLGELKGRTMDTLNQKNALQKQNMGKLAQRAAQPNAGGIGSLGGQAPRPPVNSQAGGLGNVRMMQAQGQGAPVRMAGGGIVPSFMSEERTRLGGKGVSSQAGLSGVTKEQIEAYRTANPRSAHLPNLTDAQIIDIIKATPPAAGGITPSGAVGIATPPLKVDNSGVPPNTGDPFISQAVLPPAVDNSTAQGAEVGKLEVPDAIQTVTGVAYDDPSAAGMVMPTENETSVLAAMQTGMDASDKNLDREGMNASFGDMKTRLAEFDQENYSPNEDLNNFLIGMGGTGSSGAAMRGGASARDAGITNRRNRLMDEFDLEKTRLGVDAELGIAGNTLGGRLASAAAATETSLRAAFSNFNTAQLGAIRDNATRLFETNRLIIQDDNTDADRDVQILKNQTASDEKKTTAATTILKNIAEQRASLTETERASGQFSKPFQDALKALKKAQRKGKVSGIKVAMEEFTKINDMIRGSVDGVLSLSGGLDLEKLAMANVKKSFGDKYAGAELKSVEEK